MRTQPRWRFGLALAALMLWLTPPGFAQCARYEYPTRVHGEVSIKLMITDVEFSNEANEFTVFYKVEASRLGERKIKVKANFNLQLANANINRCLNLGTVDGAGVYSTRVKVPLSGTSSSPGRYIIHMEIGLTGDVSDSPDNNIDDVDIEFRPQLQITDKRPPGPAASMLVTNTGETETGPITVQRFHNQNGRFFESATDAFDGLGEGQSRRYEIPDADSSILYDVRFFDTRGILLASTQLEGEDYAGDGTVDTGSPDFPPPPDGTIIPTAPNTSLPGGGVALGSNDPKITVRVNRRKRRFHRPRYYVHTDVDLSQDQEPAVLTWDVTKHGRPQNPPPRTITENGTHSLRRMKMTRGRPQGSISLAVGDGTTDLDTGNNRWVLNETEAETPLEPGEAAIQFTPIRGDVIFRSPEANPDSFPVTVVIKFHAQGIPDEPYEYRWEVDANHLADVGFTEITQVNTDPLANGDLQLEFTALVDPDSDFGRGARTTGVETTVSFPLRLTFGYETIVNDQRERRDHDETLTIVIEAKTDLPGYNLVPQLLVVTTQGEEPVPFPQEATDIQDIQEQNTIFFRVVNTGNAPVPEGTTFRAVLKWAQGNEGDTWAEQGEFFSTEFTTTKEIVTGDIEEIHVHEPGRWICGKDGQPRPQNGSGIIGEFYETDMFGSEVGNGTSDIPADITDGSDNYAYRRIHYRPICQN